MTDTPMPMDRDASGPVTDVAEVATTMAPFPADEAIPSSAFPADESTAPATPSPTTAGTAAPEPPAAAQDPDEPEDDDVAVGEYFATCPKGFEQLLAGELASLGCPGIRPLRGQVAFKGKLSHAYRVCLWSRIASRVVLVLAHMGALNSDELYQGLVEVPWEDHIDLHSTFAVDAHGTNDELRNTQFVALRSKDAICDRLQGKLGGRPSVDVPNPDVHVVVRVRGKRATCGIDLSGTPLFWRGYERQAPSRQRFVALRPDYASAMLAAGGWYRRCRHDEKALVAAYAGAGTILAEAAGQALDAAPGLLRLHWGFERWLGHSQVSWKRLVNEAERRREQGMATAAGLTIAAVDPRDGATSACRSTLRAAGLDVEPRLMRTVNKELEGLPDDTLVTCDLSWLRPGEEALEVAALGVVSTLAMTLPPSSSLVALSASRSLEAVLGQEADESTEVIVGRDEAAIATFGRIVPEGMPAAVPANSLGTPEADGDTAAQDTEAGQDGNAAQAGQGNAATDAALAGARTFVTLKDGSRVPVLVPTSDQFAARLEKVAKLRAKWGRAEDVSCYRVYDADLPDYAVAIDLYQASELSQFERAGGRWLVVQEYAAPKDIDPEVAHRRLLDVLAIAPRVLGVDPSDVTLRVRRQARGGSQYADGGREGDDRRGGRDSGRRRSFLSLEPGAHLVDEGGLTFEVNFAERLDTGIFLDHRDVRAQVREMAKQMKGSKRFLNLFAYTGTATCYAADGGAGYTTTVDLSRTYLDWARRNMARNGFEGPQHEYEQADVVHWISEMRRTRNRWDLVFCDPPTFSNSSRMSSSSFDVQRDHAELLIGCSRILARGGRVVFSCNLRGFRPDVEALERAGVLIEDITDGTIPEDFSRNSKVHHVFLLRREE